MRTIAARRAPQRKATVSQTGYYNAVLKSGGIPVIVPMEMRTIFPRARNAQRSFWSAAAT
jgi:hypothetical protein